VIDLTHRIRPHDIRAGALTLWRNAAWLRDSVVLAVVDPGVGTRRRPVAVEAVHAGAVLIGPDNGLLLPAAHALGGASAAVRLRTLPPAPGAPEGLGATFDGRDLFSPVAARIAAGESTIHQLGDPIDPDSLEGRPVPGPIRDDGRSVRCEVLWIDRFGNAQLNARPEDVAHLGGRLAVTLATGGRPIRARGARAFGELGAGELGLVTDSYGLLALAFAGAPAARRLGIAEGDPVYLGTDADE
jgi:S-adenosyl-L-methionine hydrolase (adenosine-forming)